MSDSDPRPAAPHDLVASSPHKPALPASAFPGFALPESALHSIPLPAEFDELVKSAIDENRVVTPFPKFFNGVFRRQGVVNKHALRALESVGQSLSQLAREIESRDRVLEKLATHLNTYGEHVHRGQMTLAHFSQELASQLSEVAGNSQARLDEVSERSRTHVESLVAKARSTERRLGDLQGLSDALNTQILELRGENERRLSEAIKPLGAELKELAAARQLAEAATAKLRLDTDRLERRVGESLPAAEERIVRRLVELTTPVQQELVQTGADVASLRDQSVATGEALGVRLDRLVGEIEEQRNRSSQLVGSIDALLVRFADFEQRAEAAAAATDLVRRDAEGALAAHTLRTEGRLTAQREELGEEIRRHFLALQGSAAAADSRLAKAEEVATEAYTHATAARGELERQATSLQAAEVRLAAQDRALGELNTWLDRRQKEIEARLAALESGISSRLDAFEKQQQVDSAQTQARNDALRAREESLATAQRVSSRTMGELVADVGRLRSTLSELAEVTTELSTRTTAAESTLHGPVSELGLLLPALREHLQQFQESPTAAKKRAAASRALTAVDDASAAQADGFYVALEARFRGSRAVIRERQSKYLPTIADARKRVETFPPRFLGPTGKDSPQTLPGDDGVLDLGCGRGEWLELLKENRIPALGVDRNRYFLQMCRQRNCAVVDADLMEYLRSAPAESVAAVTSFHVIEHLPTPVFQEMIAQVFRVLRRGGMAIFETPNPANVLTSSLNFLLDPTHVRPVHPELARLMFEMGGFGSVRLEFMSPYEAYHRVEGENDALAQRFNQYFHGPQDFAVIGVKP